MHMDKHPQDKSFIQEKHYLLHVFFFCKRRKTQPQSPSRKASLYYFLVQKWVSKASHRIGMEHTCIELWVTEYYVTLKIVLSIQYMKFYLLIPSYTSPY